MNSRDEYNPRIYGDFLDDILTKRKNLPSTISVPEHDFVMKGQIMCNEMKMQSSIYWYTQSHEDAGFGTDSLNLWIYGMKRRRLGDLMTMKAICKEVIEKVKR